MSDAKSKPHYAVPVKLIFYVIFLIQLVACASLYAAVDIPQNLDSSDREQVVKILGWGTSSKLLSDPYPMGGYPGVEVGLAIESVPIDELGRLGNRRPPQESFTYPKITVGKGLYHNIDTFVHFIPFNESTGLSEYGGLVKWCFHEATFFPGTFAIALHGNSSNVGNIFTSQSIGADFVTGININYISLFLGGGRIVASGRFRGGPNGITDSGRDEITTVDGFHSVIGGGFRIQQLFAVMQIDLYNVPVFSSKLGLRF